MRLMTVAAVLVASVASAQSGVVTIPVTVAAGSHAFSLCAVAATGEACVGPLTQTVAAGTVQVIADHDLSSVVTGYRARVDGVTTDATVAAAFVADPVAPPPPPAGPTFPLVIDAGGPGDQYFSAGSIGDEGLGVDIAGTTNDVPYRTERYGSFAYNVPVPNGTYTVTLQFAEIYWTAAGSRRFNVTLEGQAVLSSFDIFAAAGARMTAHDRTFTATVSDGVLNVGFATVTDNASVAGLIIAAGAVVPPGPVDAVLSWSAWTGGAWSECIAGSQSRIETQTATIVTPAQNGGVTPALSASRTAIQPCAVAPPPPVVTPPVVSIAFGKGSCVVSLSAVASPDGTTGWGAQYRRNGANSGSRDTTSPYTRSVTMTSGDVLSVVWTKSGAATITQPLGVVACQ